MLLLIFTFFEIEKIDSKINNYIIVKNLVNCRNCSVVTDHNGFYRSSPRIIYCIMHMINNESVLQIMSYSLKCQRLYFIVNQGRKNFLLKEAFNIQLVLI